MTDKNTHGAAALLDLGEAEVQSVHLVPHSQYPHVSWCALELGALGLILSANEMLQAFRQDLSTCLQFPQDKEL